MQAINNLLLDLGGVLYEIDVPKTVRAYEALRPASGGAITFTMQDQHEWFSRLDRGDVEIDDFLQGIQEEFGLVADPETLRRIWRELLIGLYPGREATVQRLAQRYGVALLSNTNRYHYEQYIDECRGMFGAMDHVFLSYEMGLRKPDPAIFEAALAQAGWRAEETLFADDSRRNVDAAAALGLHTWWIETPADFDRMVAALLDA
ncbi:MAG: glucose-1-phosphatase [Bacteroidia bacterium]